MSSDSSISMPMCMLIDHLNPKLSYTVLCNKEELMIYMTEKKSILKELGEEELLLPELVNAALAANERIKYYFTLLQTAQSRALHTDSEFSSLKKEREIAGVENALLDSVVQGAKGLGSGTYRIPYTGEIFSAIKACMQEMSLPILGQGKAHDYDKRLTELLEGWPAGEEALSEQFLQRITSGDRKSGDSLHLLVMDMHRTLNSMQGELSQENIDGSMTYLLEEDDRVMVRAFMAGVNRTAPLKFDHPGLGTTATRICPRLVIQNDIGLTDAHMLVVNIEGMTASIVHTDIHMPRLKFFQSLFDAWDMKWEDALSKRGSDRFEKEVYHLLTGRYTARNFGDLGAFLTHLGSRIVFLIDWNRARKRLGDFLPNKDCIAVLKWAANNEVGHIAFFKLGGERIIYDALLLSVPCAEPLHQILGREKCMEYFKWVLQTAATGLLADSSRSLLQDEIKAELLGQLGSAYEKLMGMCEEHTSLIIEAATAVSDSLLKRDVDFAARSAQKVRVWKGQADEIVRKVRFFSRRSEEASFFTSLINASDDALDHLEEASFLATLILPDALSREVHADLSMMAEIAHRCSQEVLKSLISAREVHKGYSREEMADFLGASDSVMGLEKECDEARRKTVQGSLRESEGDKGFLVCFELTRSIMATASFLANAAGIMHDNILENMGR
ncbi:MAG: hypothetical protein J5U19_09760 [Candidatus Methanoperedens sp.]|nr:hypothetical protein [Candidatus Methanoperedens sp.]